MESSVKFTETENKIRKKWLFWSTVLPAIVLGCIIIVAMFSVVISSDFTAMMQIILLFLFSAGGFYMSYYRAYKNPGTNLLLSIMIVGSLNIPLTLLKPENLSLMKTSISFSLLMLMMLFFNVIVLYYSYKLRKINKNMQERRLRAFYTNATSVFSTATNLEELNEQFTKLRNSDDSRSTVYILSKAYDQQKKMLELANNTLK